MFQIFILFFLYSNFIFSSNDDDSSNNSLPAQEMLFVRANGGQSNKFLVLSQDKKFIEQLANIVLSDLPTVAKQDKNDVKKDRIGSLTSELIQDLQNAQGESINNERILAKSITIEPWVQNFYVEKRALIELKHPELKRYFNWNIILFLSKDINKSMDENEDESLKQILLWKLFIDTYKNVLKKIYEDIENILKIRTMDGTIPFRITIREEAEYQDFITEAFLALDLDYKKTNDSVLLTEESKKKLTSFIVEKIDFFVNTKIKTSSNLHIRYSLDKQPSWVNDFMKKNLAIYTNKDKNFIKALYSPKIIGKIAYDIQEIASRNLNKEEEEKAAAYDNLAVQAQIAAVKHFYDLLYTKVLYIAYKSFFSFKEKHNLTVITNEDVVNLLTEVFENCPYNIFQQDGCEHILIKNSFAEELLVNFTKKINLQIRERFKEGDKIPHFILQDLELEQTKKLSEAASFKDLRKKEAAELLLEDRKRHEEHLAILAAKYEQEQREKELRHQKALEHKQAKEKEEQEKARQQEEANKAQIQTQEAKNKSSAQQGQLLQDEKTKNLNILHQKDLKLNELEELLSKLKKAEKIDTLLQKIRDIIRVQRGSFGNKKGKDLKKQLADSFKEITTIDNMIEEAENLIQEAQEVQEKVGQQVGNQKEEVHQNLLVSTNSDDLDSSDSLTSQITEVHEITPKNALTAQTGASNKFNRKNAYQHNPYSCTKTTIDCHVPLKINLAWAFYPEHHRKYIKP